MSGYMKIYYFVLMSMFLLLGQSFVSAMEKELISTKDSNKQMLKDFEVGTKTAGAVIRIFSLDEHNINAIDMYGKANVAFVQVGQDEEESIIIRAPEKFIDQLEVAIVDNNILTVAPQSNGAFEQHKDITYCVGLKNIMCVKSSGAIKTVALSPVKTKELSLILQGKSKFTADGVYDLDTDLLDVLLKDEACVSLSGRAQKQRLALSDSAELNAQGLKTNTIVVDAYGESKMKVCMVDVIEDDGKMVHMSNIFGQMRDSSVLEYQGKPYTRIQQNNSSRVQQTRQ